MKKRTALVASLAMVPAMPLTLEAGQIDPGTVRIELVSGEVLMGQVADEQADPLVVEHALLGRVELPQEQVEQVWAAAEQPVEAADAEVAADVEPEPEQAEDGAAQQQVDPEDAEPIEESPWDDWDFRINAGFSGRTGQSESINARTAASAERDTEDTRLFIEGIYSAERSDGATSRNEFYGEIDHEWKYRGTPWSAFATGEYDFDQFEPWRHRAGGFGGLAYKVFEGEPISWRVRAGAGVRREIGGEQRWLPEGLIGSNLTWTIDDRQSLSWRSRIYPDLDHFGDARFTNRLEWTFSLSNDRSLELNLGAEHEYESRPPAGSERSDLRYYGNIGLRF